MKSKSSSLSVKLLMYLVLFSVVILSFLWVLQVLFLNVYYEWETKNSIAGVASEVKEAYYSINGELTLDYLSYDNNVCIEIINNSNIIYTSEAMNRGCLIDGKKSNLNYKRDFESGDSSSKTYTIVNTRLNNKTIIYAMRLEDNVYAYLNTSLDPIDSTITILKNQLIIVTLLVLILSIVIALYISRKVSKPIVEVTKMAKRLGNGDYKEEFISKEDINEINDLIDTLNYSRAELAKTDELRRDLMANVSHDLKTPLTMIKAYAEMTKDLDLDNKEKTEQNLNVIIEESDRLNTLVNDILELSSNEAKIHELNIEEFDLIKLIKQIIKRYDIYVQKEKYKFIFNYKGKYTIRADRQKIEQVIYNLINNAINYTGKDNKVEITVEKRNEVIRVSVSDTGKGIEEKDIKLIWDKYYKNDKHHKRNVIGTGLGLNIVKNILEQHHYNYGVNSVMKEGTTFYFEIKKNDIV